MFLLLIISRVQSSCISSIGDLMADTLTNPYLEFQQILPYLYFSGKGINDFGLYENCQEKYQYAVIQLFVPTTPASVNMGICFNKECSIQEINKSIQSLKKLILPAAKYIFEVDVTDYELKLFDTQISQKATYSTYFFLLFLMLFILIQVCVTYRNQQLNTLPNQIQIQHQNLSDIQQISTYLDEEEYLLNNKQQNQIEKKETLLPYFDIQANFEECCKPSTSKFESLNGIRFLGFLMCVFGNTGISMLLQCDFLSVQHYGKHYILLIVFGCLYSVEIFLWLSGFFAILSLNKTNCLKCLLLRIAKIWPLVTIVILINSQIIPYLYDGPRWFYIERYTKCGKWWQNLLFINNFDDENYCSLWLWQLSLDMQLFLLCTIIMMIYKWKKMVSISLTIILLVLSQSYVIYTCITKEYGIPYFAAFTTDIYKQFYYRPWFRAPPYFIGMLTAFFYLNYKGRIRLWLQNASLISGILIMIYLTFGWYDTMYYGQDYYPKLFSQLYEGTMRTIYALGITLVTLPNLLGNKNFVYQFLNYTPIRYIVKFTFSGYLIHMLVIEVVIASFYNRLDFNVQTIATVYLGCLCIISVNSFLFRMLIEIPLQIKPRKFSIAQKQKEI